MFKHVISSFAVAMVALVGCVGDFSTDEALDEEVGVSEQEVALPPPTGLAVTVVSTTRMDLTWNPSVGATKYIIMRGLAGPGSETSYTSWPGTSTTFVANYLLPNTQYCWQVKNVNVTNEVSGPSNEVCASTSTAPTPAAPSNVVATATSSTRITVTWNAVAGATNFRIYQGQGMATPTLYTSVSGSTTTLNIASLTPSTQYCYAVDVTTVNGTSPQSTPLACATTFANGLEAYYRFDERLGTTANDASGFSRHATLSGGTSWSTDKAPIADNISVLSISSATTSVASVPTAGALRLTGTEFTIALWVKPVAAGDLRILGMRQAGCTGTLGWDLAQDAVNGLRFRGQNGTVAFGSTLTVNAWTHVAVTLGGGTLRAYLNGNQVASGAYAPGNSLTTTAMQFGHAGGCAGSALLIDEARVLSRQLTAVEVETIGELPVPPANLMITSTTSSRQNLSWTATPLATKYLIYKGTMSGDQIFLTSNTPTTYSNGHLTPSTQYSWYVRAVANGLISDPSNEVIGTTLAGPAAPMNVVATAASASRINVTYSAVPGAVKYYLYQSTDNVTFTFKATGTGTTLAATGLTGATTYYYYVQSEDTGFTKSPPSATVMATTL